MDSKKVIEKLVKIADNQQKIINKLAQAAGLPMGGEGAQPMGGASADWADVSQDLHNKLQSIPAAKRYGVTSAKVGGQTGNLDAELHVPQEDKNFHLVVEQIKKQLAGQSIRSNDGQTLTLSSNPANISLHAAWG